MTLEIAAAAHPLHLCSNAARGVLVVLFTVDA